MTFLGGDLYAGGDFTTAGDVPANYIAKWDGTQWSALGSGTNGQVRALLAVGNDLIVGGDFTIAGGDTAMYIAKWDGSQWSEFGGGMDQWVRSLALINGEIYAGGSFTKAGNDSINRFAKWTGTHWEGFGSGLTPSQWGNPEVSCIVPLGDDIYISGTFEVAGAKPSSFLAHWLKYPVAVPEPEVRENDLSLGQNYPNPFSQISSFKFQVSTTGQVTLKILDLSGREVAVLMNEVKSPGSYTVKWDATDIPAGVYFYQLQSNGMLETRKMIVCR
jgi:hypothetical protein